MRRLKRPADYLEEEEDDDEDVETEQLHIRSASSIPSAPRVIGRHRHRLRRWYGSSETSGRGGPKKTEFNIFKAIIRHPNIFFHFATRLPPDTMMNLYAIDKEFHWRLNKYSTSIIHEYAKHHAPEATDVFTWDLFSGLCISDPTLKPMDGRPHLAREAPSLRWTKMVFFRDAVVRDILTLLAAEGHRFPRAMKKVLMKYWVLMTVQRQKEREAFVQAPDYWTNADIYLFQMFLVKLDLHFSHPIHGKGICGLGHCLLTQMSLTVLWHVLTGRYAPCYDLLGELVLQTYPTGMMDLDEHPWMAPGDDNPLDDSDLGALSHEEWDTTKPLMDSGVDHVIREGVRRGLDVQRYYLDFALYGYVDMETGKNIPFARKYRGRREMVVADEGWPDEEVESAQVRRLNERFMGEPDHDEVAPLL